MSARFPAANYFIAGSRFRPGLDGGYTVAALRRAQHFYEQGGIRPTLLTFDFWPDYDEVVTEFVAVGLMDDGTVVRNLLQDVRRDPGFLRRRAARDRTAPDPAAQFPGSAEALVGLTGTTDSDSHGRPWRTVWTGADGGIRCTDFLDCDGKTVLRVPFVSGRADWHRAPISIVVFSADGAAVGELDGFGGLYSAWVEHVLEASSPELLNVVVVESRQVGELLADLPGDNIRLVHTVHSAHTQAPYQWDSAIDGLWASWFDQIDQFDAIIWPTERQRQAVERRFGPRDNFWVIPHAAGQEAEIGGATLRAAHIRDPNLAVVIGRLVPLKRVDHAVEAFRAVHATNPRARLHIYGEGPDENRLRRLIDEWGIARAVEFKGFRADAAEALEGAAALVLTSTYEGQSLVTLEALSRGCPVVAYDVNYGPAEMISDGRSGFLVADGDRRALAAALGSVLGHPERLPELSRAALESASHFSSELIMARMATLFETVVSQRARRAHNGSV